MKKEPEYYFIENLAFPDWFSSGTTRLDINLTQSVIIFSVQLVFTAKFLPYTSRISSV